MATFFSQGSAPSRPSLPAQVSCTCAEAEKQMMVAVWCSVIGKKVLVSVRTFSLPNLRANGGREKVCSFYKYLLSLHYAPGVVMILGMYQ